MATVAKDPWDEAPDPVPSFDVTQVIGTVTLEDHSEHTPREAAFLLIGRYGECGTFRFPTHDGHTCIVKVDEEE